MVKERGFRGTNIRVRSLGSDVQTSALARAMAAPAPKCVGGQNVIRAAVALTRAREALAALQPDDDVELSWINRLRPRRALIAPAEAFSQAVKRLMPALDFNTYDEALAKSRRAERRERQERVTAERRAQQVAPTAAMRAALDPKKLPKDNAASELPEEQEVFDLLSGRAAYDRKRERRQERKKVVAVDRAGKSHSDVATKRKVAAAKGLTGKAEAPAKSAAGRAAAAAAGKKQKRRRGKPVKATGRLTVGDGL
jgi:hypothetical protein